MSVAEANEILRVHVGSEVYGISNGGSDRDEIVVFVEPRNHVIGLEQCEQWVYRTAAEGAKSGPDDLDLTIYSLRKYVAMCEVGSPSIMLCLYTPPEHIVRVSNEGQMLINARGLFLTNRVGERFLGYIGQQRRKAEGSWPRGDTTQRPELIERYGFDTKFAAHMVRLAIMGEEMIGTGDVSMPMTEPWRSWLLDLRAGKYSLDEALEVTGIYEESIRRIVNSNVMPEKPNRHKVNNLLIDIHEKYWRYAQ